MQEKHLFEYSVIRLVPRVDRGECVNLGVILYCRDLKFLDVKYHLDDQRIKALFPEIDLVEIEQNLKSFQKISHGNKESGVLANQDLPSRFRWLTAKRSTILQPSEVHPGYCNDAQKMLDHLFDKMVL